MPFLMPRDSSRHFLDREIGYKRKESFDNKIKILCYLIVLYDVEKNQIREGTTDHTLVCRNQISHDHTLHYHECNTAKKINLRVLITPFDFYNDWNNHHMIATKLTGR